MAVLTGDAVQALDLCINSLVLLELVVFLQPACVMEQHIGFGGGRRNCFVLAGEGENNVDIGERVYKVHRQRLGIVSATAGQGRATKNRSGNLRPHRTISIRCFPLRR
ncbi:hypothetical protein D3C84_899980 [compost metagenome]